MKSILYNNVFNFFFGVIFFILIATSSELKIFDRISGVSDFAYSLEENFLKNKDHLVIQDRLMFSSLSYYLRDSKKEILTPHNPKNKIKSHFHLSKPLKPNHNKDFIFIGNPDALSYLENEVNIIKKQKIKLGFVNQPVEIYEVFF